MLSNLDAGLIIGCLLLVFAVAVFVQHYVTKRTFLAVDPDEKFVSSRGSQAWWSIMASIFSGSMGVGMLFSVPETGASIWYFGIVCYALASAAPFWIMRSMTKTVRKQIGLGGFAISDFIHSTIGPVARVIVSICSLFFMWIFFTAELTGIGDLFVTLAPDMPHAAVTVPIALVVIGYSIYGGLSTSIFTDKIQGIICFLLSIGCFVTVLLFYIPLFTVNPWLDTRPVGESEWGDSASGGIMLLISVTMNELINEASWQKVLAARSDKDARLGLGLATGGIIFTVLFYGILGIFGAAAKLNGFIFYFNGEEFLSFVLLLLNMHKAVSLVVASLAVCLVCSTLDSLVNGFLALFATPLKKREWSLNWGRLIIVVITIPAIIVSALQISVLTLFLVSNIIAAACVPPFLLSLHEKCAVGDLAYAIGFTCGILTILITGWSFEKTFAGGFEWFIFPRGAFHWSTLLTFVLVIIASIGGTWITAFYKPREKPPLEDKAWNRDESQYNDLVDEETPAYPDESFKPQNETPETTSDDENHKTQIGADA